MTRSHSFIDDSKSSGLGLNIVTIVESTNKGDSNLL